MVVDATVPRPLRPRGLREQEAEIERLSRENFNLKLRLYYLEERLSQRDGQKTSGLAGIGNGAGSSTTGATAAMAEIERECVDLRVALAEERRAVQEKDDLLRRAKESLATIREVSVSDRKRAEDAVHEQAMTSRELQVARRAVASANQEMADLVAPLQSAIADLATSSVLCLTAERRLAETGSAKTRADFGSFRASGRDAEKPAHSAAVGLSDSRRAHGLAAEASERASQLRSATERLAELTTAAAAAGQAAAERRTTLTAELRHAQDRAEEAEAEAAQAVAQAEAVTAAAAAGAARLGGRFQADRSTRPGGGAGGVGKSSRVALPPRLGGGGLSADASILAAELDACVAELARERAARARLARAAEQHGDALRQQEEVAALHAERCVSMERRCAELSERLALGERGEAERRGRADDALRRSRDAEAAAEQRCTESLQRQRELSEEVARLSRRLAEAEAGLATAAQLGGQAASDAARTRSQARQASAELFAARQEAQLLKEGRARQRERDGAADRAREAELRSRLASTRARLAAYRAALLGEGGVLSDAGIARPGTQEAGRERGWGGAAGSGGGGGGEEDAARREERIEEEEDAAALRALAQLRPVMAWAQEATAAAESRAEGRMRDAQALVDRLSARVEATEALLSNAASRAARFRAAASAGAGRRGTGTGGEEARALEERAALLEEALQASSARGSALQESNQLLALELQEKAGRLREVGRRGIAAAAAADALEGCIDRLGLIAREAARTAASAAGGGGESTRGAEGVRAGVADLTRRVSALAADTLEVLRQLTMPGE